MIFKKESMFPLWNVLLCLSLTLEMRRNIMFKWKGTSSGWNILFSLIMLPNFSTHGFSFYWSWSQASTQPLLAVCLVSVRDWKHFRNGDQQQVRGARALKSVLLIDPVHILKIKEGIKGIAKLLKTLHAPKKGHQWQREQAKQVVAAGRSNHPSNPRHAPDRLLKASILMSDSSMAPALTGTCLSLEEGKAAWGNLQFKLISLLSQHTADTWLRRINDWSITFEAISRYRYFWKHDVCHHTNSMNYKRY